MTEELMKFIRELGFPAAVAIYALWRIEAAVQQLAHAISRLEIALVARGIIEPDPPGSS